MARPPASCRDVQPRRSRSLLRIAADGSGEPEVLLTGPGQERQQHLVVLHPRAVDLARRHDARRSSRTGPNPTIQRTRRQVPRPRGPGAHRPRPARGAAPRPPGPGVVAGRPVRCSTCATPARAPAGRRRSAATTSRTSSRPGPDRGRLPDAGVVARRALRRRDEDEQLRDGRRRSSTQRNGAELLRLTNDEQSFSPVWSPKMRRDRVLPGPARRGRPVARAARRAPRRTGRSASRSR